MRRLIIIVLSFLAVLAFVVYKYAPLSNSDKPITLTYWGLWEDASVIQPALAEYKKLRPNVTIDYRYQSLTNYRTRVQTKINDGTGPDVFRIHNTWVGMFQGYLEAAPREVLPTSEYKEAFYPLAAESFILDDRVYAAPLEIDGLALFYNEDLLNNVGGRVPATWQQLIDTAIQTTVKDQSGQILTSGAALGLTSNVDHWPDIIGLLLLQQPGVDLRGIAPNIAVEPVAEVLRFYTDFATDPRRKTWDVNMPASTLAFAQNQLVFYFGPAWRAADIKKLNPNLRFKVVPVPKLSEEEVAWGTFWGEAVSTKTRYPKEAWEFIKFLSSKETQKLIYQEMSKNRVYGMPYSRKELAGDLSGDAVMGAFVNQGNSYKSWFLASNTGDAGINDGIIKAWEEGINEILQGSEPLNALNGIQTGTHNVLNLYFGTPR